MRHILDLSFGISRNHIPVVFHAATKGLPLNISIEGITFFGTIVFVGFDGEEFTDCPLTKADLLEVIGE